MSIIDKQLVYRERKGAPLDFEEGDDNLKILQSGSVDSASFDTGSSILTLTRQRNAGPSITVDLSGLSQDTASYAETASIADSASVATSASYAATATSASYANTSTSASYAQTAATADTASYSSFAETATLADTASIATSASYATTATSASYASTATNADSASVATSASHALNADNAISSSHALNADNAVSSSYSTTASVALSTPNAITNAETSSVNQANGLLFTKGDGTTINVIQDTSSYVKSVNGTNPSATGNVAVALASVKTGTSASMLAYSSSGLFLDAEIWIVSGESGSLSGSNGNTFIYSTSSNLLYEISPEDQAANDIRYVNTTGDTMTGQLILNADPTNVLGAATKQYVDLSYTSSTIATDSDGVTTITLNREGLPSTDTLVFSSASYAVTSSHAITASYAISASHETIKEISSSYADTASYVNPLDQTVTITGSLLQSGSVEMFNYGINNLAEPTSSHQAATKYYVDNIKLDTMYDVFNLTLDDTFDKTYGGYDQNLLATQFTSASKTFYVGQRNNSSTLFLRELDKENEVLLTTQAGQSITTQGYPRGSFTFESGSKHYITVIHGALSANAGGLRFVEWDGSNLTEIQSVTSLPRSAEQNSNCGFRNPNSENEAILVTANLDASNYLVYEFESGSWGTSAAATISVADGNLLSSVTYYEDKYYLSIWNETTDIREVWSYDFATSTPTKLLDLPSQPKNTGRPSGPIFTLGDKLYCTNNTEHTTEDSPFNIYEIDVDLAQATLLNSSSYEGNGATHFIYGEESESNVPKVLFSIANDSNTGNQYLQWDPVENQITELGEKSVGTAPYAPTFLEGNNAVYPATPTYTSDRIDLHKLDSDYAEGDLLVASDGNWKQSSTLNTSVQLPVGSTAERPSQADTGSIRFNTENDNLEVLGNTSWRSVGQSTAGTDGQTIRYEGTTQVANSVLFNSGSQVSIGNTSPLAGYALTVTNQDDIADHRMLVGRTDAVGGTQDYVEIRSTGGAGYLESKNNLIISASNDANNADITVRTERNIILSASNGAVYNSSKQIKALADPTAAQDAATKNYVDTSTANSNYVAVAGDTMTGALTISETGNALVIGDELVDADTHIVIERNFDRTGSIDFTRSVGSANGPDVIIDVNESEDFQLKYNQAADNKTGDFRIINDTTNVMEVLSTSTDVAFNGKLTNVTDPTASQDAATKNYVDNNFVELSGDTMTDTLTIDKSGDSVTDGNLPLEIIGSGLVVGDRIGNTRTFKSGSVLQFRDYGQAHYKLMNSASQFTIEQNSGGGNDGVYITFPQGSKDLIFNGKLTNVTNPTSSQDVATKDYVDSFLASTVTAAVWSTSGTVATINNASKVTFNEASSREISTNDSTQASWSTTNNEFALGEGTWHIIFDFRKDTQGSTAIRFWQMQYKSTPGTGSTGTLIDAAPTIQNTTSGVEKIHMEGMLTVPASSTRYVYFLLQSGGQVTGRFQKAICRKIS